MKVPVSIVLAVALLAAGCSKQNEAQKNVSPRPALQDDAKSRTSPPVPAVTPPPPPNPGTSDPTPRPASGQANDHSSPDFKAGGKAEIQK